MLFGQELRDKGIRKYQIHHILKIQKHRVFEKITLTEISGGRVIWSAALTL